MVAGKDPANSDAARIVLDNAWDFQLLGIGINTRSAPSLPCYPTAAMEQFSIAKISRNALAAELLDGLESWYFNKSGDQVELAFESRCIDCAN